MSKSVPESKNVPPTFYLVNPDKITPFFTAIFFAETDWQNNVHNKHNPTNLRMRGLPLCIAAEGVLGGVLIGQLVKNPWGGCKLGGGHQFGCLPYFHYTARLSFSCLVVVAQHAV